MSNNALVELDSLCNSLKSTTHMVSIIQSAMENNVLTDEADAPEALVCVFERMWDISHRFSDILDAEFAKIRANRCTNQPQEENV